MQVAWEWLWRARALEAARATARASERERTRLRRAHLAFELADRALEPVEPLKAGSGRPLALTLYREAAYWALLARQPDSAPASLGELFATQPAALAQSGLSPAELSSVHEALVDKTFVQTADDPPERLARDCELCRTFLRGLLHGSAGAVDLAGGVGGVMAQRWLRAAGALALAGLVALAAASGIRRAWRGPDLAQGAPYTLSSKWVDCHPQQRECGGARTRIFFHTQFQDEPWFEIDLQHVQQVGRVRVENRDDCCQERAMPLVVEVRSGAADAWREVARNTAMFQQWETAFPPTQARHVRLRIAGRNFFHLSRVELYRR